MAILKSKIKTSHKEASQAPSGSTHRNVQLKEKGVSSPTDDKTAKNEMLENILKKYRSAWKKLAKL